MPSENTIVSWVENFRLTGSALKKKPPGDAQTVLTPENIEAVRRAVVNSPCHSASKHGDALCIPDHSVRRVLHLDLNFHPYKIMIMQELNQHD